MDNKEKNNSSTAYLRNIALAGILGLSAILAGGCYDKDSNKNISKSPNGTNKGLVRIIQDNKPKIPQKEGKNDLIAYARYIGDNEGKRNKVYDPNPRDGKPEPTIAIGFYMDRADAKETFERVLPEVKFKDVYSGKQNLTDEQVYRLFSADLPKYIEKAESLFPEFDSYSEDLKINIVDGVFRGGLSGSPKTIALINKGDFKGAAREYLDNREYKTSKARGMGGVATRMERNANAMLKYAQELDVKSSK